MTLSSASYFSPFIAEESQVVSQNCWIAGQCHQTFSQCLLKILIVLTNQLIFFFSILYEVLCKIHFQGPQHSLLQAVDGVKPRTRYLMTFTSYVNLALKNSKLRFLHFSGHRPGARCQVRLVHEISTYSIHGCPCPKT